MSPMGSSLGRRRSSTTRPRSLARRSDVGCPTTESLDHLIVSGDPHGGVSRCKRNPSPDWSLRMPLECLWWCLLDLCGMVT